MDKNKMCPDCDASDGNFDRRDFLRTVGVTAAASTVGLPLFAAAAKPLTAPSKSSVAETAVKGLYETLSDAQKKEMCFAWDYVETTGRKRGLLRTFVSNNWQITRPHIRSDFYSKKQQMLIHDIWKGLINPDWEAKFRKQLKDDTGGKEWGDQQSIAIFGTPGSEQFEFVMTGRHMTLRADGNTGAHVAFGGPIFYGHAASGFNEKVHHPNNVFWPQGVQANKIYTLLDGKQQARALISERPQESAIAFRGGKGGFPGIPVEELSDDQKRELHKTLLMLLEPFRIEDRNEVHTSLLKQGGLGKCSLAFYKDGDIGDDKEWDNWRVEGPAFVWYFRGEPHVHVWVNVANDPSVKTNAKG